MKKFYTYHTIAATNGGFKKRFDYWYNNAAEARANYRRHKAAAGIIEISDITLHRYSAAFSVSHAEKLAAHDAEIIAEEIRSGEPWNVRESRLDYEYFQKGY